jgi:hypothetical protein
VTHVYHGSYHVKNGDATWFNVNLDATVLAGADLTRASTITYGTGTDPSGPDITVTDHGGTYTTGIDVKGADVYIAGYAERKPDFNPVAMCWKNGVAGALGDGSSHSIALEVAVASNGDVHVLGYDGSIARRRRHLRARDESRRRPVAPRDGLPAQRRLLDQHGLV